MAKEISSLQHPLIKHLVKLRKDSAYRKQQRTVVVEGKKLIQELAKTHSINLLILAEDQKELVSIAAKDQIIVPRNVIDKISGVQNPEGVLAELSLSTDEIPKNLHYLLAFDQVSDPGNMGTLMRTGLALGWEAAFLLNQCCDPYNDKAIRSAKGATFKLPFTEGSWSDFDAIVAKNNLQPLVADIDGTPIDQLSISKQGIVLLLGNEAHGASMAAKQRCQSVSIPINSQMESLNVSVAGGILMYLLKRCHRPLSKLKTAPI